MQQAHPPPLSSNLFNAAEEAHGLMAHCSSGVGKDVSTNHSAIGFLRMKGTQGLVVVDLVARLELVSMKFVSGE
jgi:hypothetical protein